MSETETLNAEKTETVKAVARPKEVALRRREVLDYIPPDVAKDAKKRLGSIYSGQAPLRGLSFEEEKKYVSQVLGVDPTTREFPQQAREFWADLTVDVPHDGTVLQIGLDADGEPINVRDWVIYQWALKHKMVGATRDEMESDHTIKFYIYDPERAENNQAKAAENRMAALTALIELKDQPNKMGFALRLLGSINPDRLSDQQKFIRAEEFAREDPERFVRVVQDPSMELRAFLAELVEKSVVSKIGSIYNYVDQTIGESETEAINFLKNKRNSGTVTELKSKLKAARDTLKATA